MIRTLSSYSAYTAKTDEIMSRYRPIAPKPEAPGSPMSESSSVSRRIRQSPYLRNLWSQLQARPTRTRKRGRAVISPPAIKRPRTHALGLLSPGHLASPAKHLSLQGFGPGTSQLPLPNLVGVSTNLENMDARPSGLVTLPLLPCTPFAANQSIAPEFKCMEPGRGKMIDLNVMAETPKETDFLQPLQEPPTCTVMVPRPIRPVGSSIRVGCIGEYPTVTPPGEVPKKPAEVETELESEALPAVISDSKNNVRLANSAYKEMIGQPECSWLDMMITSNGQFGGGSCKRICGEVILHISDSKVSSSSNGFSCWVRIEWESQGEKKTVNAFSDVVRLSCESKDYLFAWRFHTKTREGSQSSNN